MENTTILIAEDHTLVRETLIYLLNNTPSYKVLGGVSSGEEVVLMARRLNPDIIIMDINLSGEINGIEATRQIRAGSPRTKVLAISMHCQPMYAREMMKSGASGYVTKNSRSEEMLKALDEIRNNKKYICSEVKNILSGQMIDGENKPQAINTLTKREMEIISYIKKGFSSQAIGTSLSVSKKTVEVHRFNILRKLNLKNAPELVQFMNTMQL